MRLPTLKPRVPVLNHQRIELGDAWRDGKVGSTQRGYTYRWQQARKRFLAEHPICECEDCDAGRKRLRVATVVDHHIPHRGNEALFWDEKNWRAMAKECHDRKTAGGA
jgi:5-methylcytosine-specific restriction protein A